jgi:hypothetical protein
MQGVNYSLPTRMEQRPELKARHNSSKARITTKEGGGGGGVADFPNIYEPPQNSRHKNGDIKQVPI